MSKWYDADNTKKGLDCLLSGCKPCDVQLYCRSHDKPAKGNIPSLPGHCKECGEYIYDPVRDTRGMFG